MNKKTVCAVLCIALAIVMLAACSRTKADAPTATSSALNVIPAPLGTADPSASPAPAASASPAAATPVPTAAATPTPAPTAPTAAPKATAASSAPSVTKSPTDEAVNEGGSCLFVARADNASSLVWHFVSPDGGTDVAYDSIGSTFPTLDVSGGTTDTLELSDIPAGFNGWRVYCRFTNNAGSVSSGMAVVSVSEVPVTETVIDEPVYSSGIAGTYHENVTDLGEMTISGGPDYYNVTVEWSRNPGEISVWTFSGSFDASGTMYFSDCTKTTTSYYENGEVRDETYDFSGGSGTLSSNGFGGLVWNVSQDSDISGSIFR